MSEVAEKGELDAVKQAMQAGQFDSALDTLAPLLDREPDHPDALYMAAVCHRFQQHWQPAAECLERLKRLSPHLGRAHQEEGHLKRDQGDLNAAALAYTHAVRLNPSLEASFRALLAIYEANGDSAQLRTVNAQLAQLKQLPRPLVAVTDLLADGKIVKAESICRKFLQKVPTNVEGMRLLAEIAARLNALDEAEFLLESATKIAPENSRVHIDYVQILKRRQQFARANEEAQRLLASAPDNPQYQSLAAIQALQTGDFETALAGFDEVLARLPDDAVTWVSKGHALKTSGRTDEAIAAYHAAIKAAPRHGDAWFALSNLKTYTFSADEVSRMTDLCGDSRLTNADRIALYFALGKAHEDAADYATSFDYYAQGNQLKRAQSRYDRDKMSSEFARQIEVFTEDFVASKSATGCADPAPIFIVGLPRAGSTLLEQILSSHSQVDGTLELPDVLALSQRLRRWQNTEGESPGYPQALLEVSDEELRQFGEAYMNDTRVHRQGAPRFIDKMPNNFRHIGLIKLILPNAKIIDARREPMACCFSGFKQLFAEGQEFSYSLEDIGRYYVDYVELMAHWDRVLPGQVLRVQHEDVVADLGGQVKRMLEFCELPFEEECLRYYETERAVRTPSSEQVRQPIFTSGGETWQHYSEWLAPLRTALGQ